MPGSNEDKKTTATQSLEDQNSHGVFLHVDDESGQEIIYYDLSAEKYYRYSELKQAVKNESTLAEIVKSNHGVNKTIRKQLVQKVSQELGGEFNEINVVKYWSGATTKEFKYKVTVKNDSGHFVFQFSTKHLTIINRESISSENPWINAQNHADKAVAGTVRYGNATVTPLFEASLKIDDMESYRRQGRKT